MPKIRINTIHILFGLIALGVAYAASAKQLEGDWKFIKKEVSPTADASDWETVSVPHTWNVVDAQNGGGKDMQSRDGYYRGPAAYAKNLTVEKSLAGKRVFLRFEAVSSVAEVYLNGSRLGEHKGAFGAFSYEITPHLKWGEANDLRVLANNVWRDDLAPLSGDFPVFGGIYRPVHLLVKEQVCISPLQRGSHGVFMQQENVSKSKATLKVVVLLDNGKSKPAKVQVHYKLLDAAGKVVATDTDMTVIKGGSQIESEAKLELMKPHLWDGRMDPYLYTVQVAVTEGGKVLDRFSMKQGFRYFEVDPVKGFMLNGKPYQLWGINRHQDHEGKGWAISNAEHDLDISLIDEMGTRAIRLAHYPQSQHFFEKCDEKGIMVTAELPLVDCITDSQAFTDNIMLQMNEMIDLYGNFTCVFAYGLYNEMYHKRSPAAEPLLHALHDLCKERDPGRYTYGGTNQGANRKLNDTTDLLAFNGYAGWYGGASHGMKGHVEHYLNKNTQRGIAVSEYGAGASIKHHETHTKKPAPSGKWHPEEYQALHHEVQFKIMKEEPRVWGTFIWNMFDFCSVWRNEGDRPGINDKGIVSHDRKTRKDAFYFYKANWNDQPMVHLTSKRHTVRTEASTPVKVYANAGAVTLTVNGRNIGTKKPDEMKTVVWEAVQLKAGKNKVVVSARDDKGQMLRDEVVWVHDPSAMVAGPGAAQTVVQGLFSASVAERGNPPKGAFDGNAQTRWATPLKGAWLAREFEKPTEAEAISIEWYKGAERNYSFEVQTSADGLSWRSAFKGKSRKQGGMESYSFGKTHTLSHIRIICNGHGGSSWSSIVDVQIE